MIPLAVPEIRGNEWKYLKECLDTNWVSSVGPFVDRFEQLVAEYVGAGHAVATSSGTAALHLALLAGGVQPEEEVLVSTLTFIAPANAVRYCGAWPVFMDAEPTYWQMDPEKVLDFLKLQCQWRNKALWNKDTGRRVSAILPVDILGHPVDMDPILGAAREYGLSVIEDATESLGAEYKGRTVGCLADVACFSFNGNKVITTGGGGMLVTDKEEWAHKARYLSTQARDDQLEYIHHQIGYNYRLTNIQAALGVAQIEQLDEYVETKRRTASFYDARLAQVPGIELPREASWARSMYWLYTVLVHPEEYGRIARELQRELDNRRIQTRTLWCPAHRQRPYADCQAYRIEVADRLYDLALSLPSSVGITPGQQDYVADTVSALAKGAG